MPKQNQSTRIIIEKPSPVVDGGRYPAKRIVGEMFDISADIFMDGHDHLRAALSYQLPGESDWQSIELAHAGNDRWAGQVAAHMLGYLKYKIQAWPDHYGTWVSDTQKKLAAGQDIALELREGTQLLEEMVASFKGEKRKLLRSRLDSLLAEGKGAALADMLLGKEAVALMETHAPHDGEVVSETFSIRIESVRAQYSAWYELFPRSQASLDAIRAQGQMRSGTFADCELRLPDIRAMGFDVVYFPPIHPIGETFRKGKNNTLTTLSDDVGSPYAIGHETGGHKAVHPDLGTLEDFRHFVEAAKAHGLEVALDFAIQCSPDHPYLKEHPEWFRIRPDGSIKHAENPPKKYQDIVNVNFDSPAAPALWEELRSIVQFWIEQRVTIFRVDNPHTKPFAFWEWLIGSIQETRPDIIFLSEAFARPKIMYALAKLGFTQSYSYFTWRNTKTELTEYLTELTTGEAKDFFRPNFFPVTPDILPSYLQTSGRAGFVIRLALAATLGTSYGVYSGYELCESAALPGKEEYADSERFELRPRDWDAPGNIKPFITQLNRIRNENAALQQFRNLRFCNAANGQMLFYCKWSDDKKNIVFIAVNLDPHTMQEGAIELPLYAFGIDASKPVMFDDLLLGHSWSWTGDRQFQHLNPATNPVAIFRIHIA